MISMNLPMALNHSGYMPNEGLEKLFIYT